MVYRCGPRDPFCRFDLGERSVRADESYDPEELKFLKIINEYREDHHLPTLLLSDALTKVSRHHSEDMSLTTLSPTTA